MDNNKCENIIWEWTRHAAISALITLIIVSCSLDSNVTSPLIEEKPVVEVPQLIQILKGNNQKEGIGKQLKDSIIVCVVDKNLKPIGGIDVSFIIIMGEGAVSTSTVKSNSLGKASVAWTLGVGPEQILKVFLTNSSTVSPVYLYANNNLTIKTSWTTGYNFSAYNKSYSHDNRILETNYFLTFSDGASDDAKIIYAKMAEESLYELKELFKIASDIELGVDTNNSATKLKIYTIKNATYDQLAYNNGFVLYGYDSPRFQSWREGNFWFRREIKHETMHVVHFKLGLDPPGGPYTDTWFVEGIAEHVSGGAFTPITNLEEWNRWINTPGNINPIKIHSWNNFPDRNRAANYYNAFGLAVRYLVDSKGLGKSIDDLKAMIKEVKLLGSFKAAFQKHMGISIQYYEDNFLRLIEELFNK